MEQITFGEVKNEIESLKDIVYTVCKIDGYSQDLFEISDNKIKSSVIGFSGRFNKTLVFRFTLSKFTIVVPKKYDEMVKEHNGTDIIDIKSPKDYIQSYFSTYDEAESFLRKYIPQYVEDYPPTERFGCCHRYVECSNAKECLAPDKFHAKGCYYKNNLENGRIFYGENANT